MLITISGEPKEMKPLLAFMTGGKAPKKAAVEEEEEEVTDEEEEEEVTDEEEEGDEIEIEALVKLCQKKTKANAANRAKIAGFLKEFKVKTLNDLKPAKFAAFKAKVDKLK